MLKTNKIMKQETLEEVAERILANNIDGLRDALKDDDLFFFYKGVIQCYGEAMAKWQQERSYSEEEVIELLQKALTHKDDGETGSLVTAQGEIRTANFFSWFERFKKK
jgi:hypothetical protein